MPHTPTRTLALLCTSRSWGGLEMNVARLAQWLHAAGHPVCVVGLPESPLGQALKGTDVPLLPFSRPVKYFDIQSAYLLATRLRQAGCRACLVTTTHDLHTAALARQLFSRRLVLVYWQQMQLGVRKRGWLHTSIYRSLAAWVAPMPWLRAQVGTHTRMALERVWVIPLGVDGQALRETLPETQAQARALLDLPEAGPWVGLIGRIDPKKGQHLLLEAVALLAPRWPALRVLLLGDPSIGGDDPGYPERLRARVGALGLADRVVFRPGRPDVAVGFRALDVFAMCSSGETYGVVTVEAMACGTPIVAAHAGSNPDLLAGGARGLLFAPDDPGALAAAIETVLDDPAGAQARAAAAEAAALGELGKTAMLQQFEALFQRLGL